MTAMKTKSLLIDYTEQPVTKINFVARKCYASEIPEEAEKQHKFVQKLIERKHESPLEFVHFTWMINTNRAIANEMVRHRIASWMQESTRYVKYKNEIDVIPSQKIYSTAPDIQTIYFEALNESAIAYRNLLEKGVPTEVARDVLPLATKTVIMMDMNLREYRHFLSLRLANTAHEGIREVAKCTLSNIYNCYDEETFNTLFHNMEIESWQRIVESIRTK